MLSAHHVDVFSVLFSTDGCTSCSCGGYCGKVALGRASGLFALLLRQYCVYRPACIRRGLSLLRQFSSVTPDALGSLAARFYGEVCLLGGGVSYAMYVRLYNGYLFVYMALFYDVFMHIIISIVMVPLQSSRCSEPRRTRHKPKSAGQLEAQPPTIVS